MSTTRPIPSSLEVARNNAEIPVPPLTGGQATTAIATIATLWVDKPVLMRRLVSRCADNKGAAGATTLEVQVDGVQVASSVTSHAYNLTDGTKKTTALGSDGTGVAVAAGSRIDLAVTAVTTSTGAPSTGLSAQLDMVEDVDAAL